MKQVKELLNLLKEIDESLDKVVDRNKKLQKEINLISIKAERIFCITPRKIG